jgi:hypothetical protein
MEDITNDMHFNMIIAIARKLKMEPAEFVDSYCDADKNQEYMRGMVIRGEKKVIEKMNKILNNTKKRS